MAVNRAYHSPVARKTHSVGRLGGVLSSELLTRSHKIHGTGIYIPT